LHYIDQEEEEGEGADCILPSMTRELFLSLLVLYMIL
jgi:hypothetical protein